MPSMAVNAARKQPCIAPATLRLSPDRGEPASPGGLDEGVFRAGDAPSGLEFDAVPGIQS